MGVADLMGDHKPGYNDERRESQRIKPRWKEDWPKCKKKLEKRMRDGHRDYGDRSFERPLVALLDEVEEEILDQINWSFIAWTRNRELAAKVRVLEDRLDDEEIKKLVDDFEKAELA